jgi:hypothetical protein
MAMISPHKRPCCVAALLATLVLAGCVDSAAPQLTGAQPMFGPTVRIHGYSLAEGRASGPTVGSFHWDGAQYRVVSTPTFDIAAFTVVPLAGDDLIVQSRSSRPQAKGIEYALARKVGDGAYFLSVIDEGDANEATRAKFCIKTAGSSCRLESPEAVLAFAHATAAKPDSKRSLALIVSDQGR